MTLVSIILCIKILGTIVIVTIPFLFFSKEKLEKTTNMQSDNPGFFRLYGMAVTSLLIAYSFGLYDSVQGVFPFYAVVMGLFSNGGASLMLLRYSNKTKANRFVTVFFASVFVLLVVALSVELMK